MGGSIENILKLREWALKKRLRNTEGALKNFFATTFDAACENIFHKESFDSAPWSSIMTVWETCSNAPWYTFSSELSLGDYSNQSLAFFTRC